MTYRHALTHCISALLFVFSGCSSLDEPGGLGSADDAEEPDDVEEPDDAEEPDDEEPEDAEDPPGVECSLETFQIGIGEESPSGSRGKAVFDMASAFEGGEVTFFDGKTSGMELELIYMEGPVDVFHIPGEVEGCSPRTELKIPVKMMIRSEDDRLSELLDATLVHSSEDPESVEVIAGALDFDAVGGTLQPPKVIGPEENPVESFTSLSMTLRLVLGEPRPMASVGEDVLEEVHGVLLGTGELAEEGGPEDDPESWGGNTREFFLGSIRLKL